MPVNIDLHSLIVSQGRCVLVRLVGPYLKFLQLQVVHCGRQSGEKRVRRVVRSASIHTLKAKAFKANTGKNA